MSALSVFALRLAAGMIACLLLLSPADVNPRSTASTSSPPWD